MSTIKATNITDLTGTYTSTTTAINRGIAKAWVNFDGTTATPSTIRASYNVSSVTKNGTGDYTVNFTTAMVDTNYSATFGGYNTGVSDGGWISAYNTGSGSYPTGVNTGSLRLATYTSAGSPQDQQAVSVAIFR